jgi:NAD(P)-dependent dehydrogenase (short-subunit alcohol dehydrogenase family)
MSADPVLSSKPILERLSLIGKNALVTGGNKGIGRAIVHAYAQAGANVAIIGRNESDNKKVLSEIKSLYPGIEVIEFICDVTIESQVNDVVEKVVKHFGSLEIACNNAGIAEWVNAEEMEFSAWQRMITNNLDSAFLCAKAQAKYMIKQGYGKILFTASLSGKVSNYPQHQSHYNSAKAGVLSLTRCLATEWAPKGVRVNSLSPGFTITPLLDDLKKTKIGEQYFPLWISRIPAKKMGEVSDMQGAAVYLAAEASDYVTGIDLVIDGGYLAW